MTSTLFRGKKINIIACLGILILNCFTLIHQAIDSLYPNFSCLINAESFSLIWYTELLISGVMSNISYLILQWFSSHCIVGKNHLLLVMESAALDCTGI